MPHRDCSSHYRSNNTTITSIDVISKRHLCHKNVPSSFSRTCFDIHFQVNTFKDLLAIRNNDGYTPLAMATVRNSRLFEHLINFERIHKIPQNRLGSVTWVTYDVTDVTTFARSHYNKYSVLHIIAHNSHQMTRYSGTETKDSDTDFLELEPIKSLVACKWDTYRWVYIFWMFVHILYMVAFTAITAELNSAPITKVDPDEKTTHVEVQPVHMWIACFLPLPVIYIVLELLDLYGTRPYRIQFLKNRNLLMGIAKCLRSEWTITGNGPFRIVNVGFACFTIEWFLLYTSRAADQDIALSLALLLGWMFVLFFTRACRVTCRFSIMLQKMFFHDLVYFLTVYGIVLVAFSFAMNAMITHSDIPDTSVDKVVAFNKLFCSFFLRSCIVS